MNENEFSPSMRGMEERADTLHGETVDKKNSFIAQITAYFNAGVAEGKFGADHVLSSEEICELLKIEKGELRNYTRYMFPDCTLIQILDSLGLPSKEKKAAAFKKADIEAWFLETAKATGKAPTKKMVSQAAKQGLLPANPIEFARIAGMSVSNYTNNFSIKLGFGEIKI